MENVQILGVDIHDAVMDLKRAVEDDKLIIRSAMTIRALARIRLGADGRVDPHHSGPRGPGNRPRVSRGAANSAT
jgi:hypothetical protein